MKTPRLLVVDLDAVRNELDNVRGEFVTRAARARASARREGSFVNDEDIDAAENLWADDFPALELLRDEVR